MRMFCHNSLVPSATRVIVRLFVCLSETAVTMISLFLFSWEQSWYSVFLIVLLTVHYYMLVIQLTDTDRVLYTYCDTASLHHFIITAVSSILTAKLLSLIHI